MDPPGDIMVQTSQPKRSLTPVSSGPPFYKMPTSCQELWTRANVAEKLTTEQLYFVAVDYLSKWVEAKALPTNDARVVCKFLKSLFAQIWSPVTIISDRGTHFCNDQFAKVMQKYGVTHRLSTAFTHKTSGQVEVSNRGLKRILERTIGENRASWSDKLDDALWAFRTAFKNIPGVYSLTSVCMDKACPSSIELGTTAYWAKSKQTSIPVNTGCCDHRLKDFLGKLKARWNGLFTISRVFPYGTVAFQAKRAKFQVICMVIAVKHYFGGIVPHLVVPDLQKLSPKRPINPCDGSSPPIAGPKQALRGRHPYAYP
ncbi:reverse transcriptase domain-containing protein [Tanacetum coccineum]